VTERDTTKVRYFMIPGPVPLAAREAALSSDDYRCAACGLGPGQGVGLGVGASSLEPARMRAVCWPCLLSTGATRPQLLYQLPREGFIKRPRHPDPEDRVLRAIERGHQLKRDIQRVTHLKLEEVTAAISALSLRGMVTVTENQKCKGSYVVALVVESRHELVSRKKAL
jgi:hypothetical protein